MQANETVSRRDLIRRISAAGFAAWLGLDWVAGPLDGHASSAADSRDPPASTPRGITRLRLQGGDLENMRAFYARTMGFEADSARGVLTVRTGSTTIEFSATSQVPEPVDVPYYHIAWAIPENKLALAKQWLRQRTPLLKHPDGRDEFHFRNVNRHAAYFADPSGNILELIARHNLNDGAPGPFTLADILYVNHFGLVVDDVMKSIEVIRKAVRLELRQAPSDSFATLGDEYRHLVLVRRKRLWLPEGVKPAKVFASDVVLHGVRKRQMELDGYPYHISLEA
jgi:catechol-2,3-dioxygenase